MVQAILNNIKSVAKKKHSTIVFPEGEDERVIKAVEIIKREELAVPILLGKTDVIQKKADSLKVNIAGILIINPEDSKYLDQFSNKYYELRKQKGVSPEIARVQMHDNNFFGAMMVELNLAEGMVSGAIHPTADTLRPALQIIKTVKGTKTASSFFIMVLDKKILFFSDCGFVVNPTEDELCEIAISTARSAISFGITPKVAMLSFSTHGSAQHALVDKVRNATKKVQNKFPQLIIDGEIQLDAAIVPNVAKSKCPDSKLKGDANVLIFPDLNSGNIGYKLVQRLAGAKAIGPIVQGLKKPVNDLSRGCSVEDIVNVTAITALQVQE